MQWELNMLLVQHDTDLLIFDEPVKLSTSLTSRAQLTNQNRPKNYSAPLFNNIYASFSVSTTMNTIPTQHQVTTTYTNPPTFRPIKTTPWTSQQQIGDLKSHWRPNKRNTASKTICVYIVANLVTEFSTINSLNLPSELISYLKHLHPPHYHRHSSQLKAHQHPAREKRNFCIQSLARTITFFFSALTLTPANSVEVSNKHLVSRCTIKINGKSENLSTLFDTGVTGETFMDKSYALQHNIPLISLIKAIPLQGIDGNPTGSGPITHFVYVPFVPPGCAPQLTRLFITDIPNFL